MSSTFKPADNVNTDMNDRWENGVSHHHKSIEIYSAIARIDYEFGGDYFCFKSGGDGDNGEFLMYLLDVYFETLDQLEGLVK